MGPIRTGSTSCRRCWKRSIESICLSHEADLSAPARRGQNSECRFGAFCKYGAEPPLGLLEKKHLIPWIIGEADFESEANCKSAGWSRRDRAGGAADRDHLGRAPSLCGSGVADG